MNELKVVSLEGQLVTDSREVAEMIGKEHKNLLADIRNYISSLMTFVDEDGKLMVQPSDFFIESSYVNTQNKSLPCFLVTKKGCDMVANKMIGDKGVQFTASYVSKFDEMEKEIHQPRVLSEKEQLMASMKLSLETATEIVEVKKEIAEVRNIAENQITLDHGEQRRLQKAVAIKVYEIETDPAGQRRMFRELYREIKDRFAVASYKDVKRKDLQNAIRYVDAWLPRKVS